MVLLSERRWLGDDLREGRAAVGSAGAAFFCSLGGRFQV